MLLFRSLTIGMLGACLYLLFGVPSRAQAPAAILVPAAPSPAITVIDVARGVPAATVLELIRLAPGERVIAVDDVPVANNLAAGAALGDRMSEVEASDVL